MRLPVTPPPPPGRWSTPRARVDPGGARSLSRPRAACGLPPRAAGRGRPGPRSRAGPRGAPATTSTISPFTLSGRAMSRSRRLDSTPRTYSSCSLVASRQRKASRSPRAAIMSASAFDDSHGGLEEHERRPFVRRALRAPCAARPASPAGDLDEQEAIGRQPAHRERRRDGAPARGRGPTADPGGCVRHAPASRPDRRRPASPASETSATSRPRAAPRGSAHP